MYVCVSVYTYICTACLYTYTYITNQPLLLIINYLQLLNSTFVCSIQILIHLLRLQVCEGFGSPAHSRSGSTRSMTSCDGGPGLPRAGEGSPSRRALQDGGSTSRSPGHMTWTTELKPAAVSVSAGSPSSSPSRTRDGLRTTPDSGSVLLIYGALYL